MARSGEARSAAEFVPAGADLEGLRHAARACQGCDLFRDATQTVFGEGRAPARVMLVGEQPGDQEDRQGAPFVGPAGRMLDRALEEAGIDRDEVYVTNAVKHFKFTTKGKRRIHKSPTVGEMKACRPWLDAELERVEPEMTITLGATAGKALLGSSFRVSERRGQILPWEDGRLILATIHPSAVLRGDDREAMYQGFLSDLRVAAQALK
ncbi:UdgX family uracil-DNA binding protein [Bailinhaonella thermotolerans]|uniref:Type-4 uracil-DNA glycosylase n=1 Tax=Bailinhaonella thermotolerans TaxID=1070861 RepID=A0A3A4AY33_9ACTN|nr:UdgX family uracil-DNA binding protein [Bailinhaonella thermotolerans]RJL30787.1 uracil-DNA glycosylase [Bailinhaonella thermotolerans]